MKENYSYYINAVGRKDIDNIILEEYESKSESMVPTDESGLCLKKDGLYPSYCDHVEVKKDILPETKIKVVESIELKEIDKLRMEKSLYKKIATLFAEKRNKYTSNSLIVLQGINFILQSMLVRMNYVRGSMYQLNVIAALCWLACLHLNLKIHPKKALEYLKLSLMSTEDRIDLKDDINRLGLNSLVNDCTNVNNLSYYSTEEDVIKELCRTK